MSEATEKPSGWSVTAIVALVAAVLAPPLGLALGIVALVKVRRSHHRGRGLAIAAIVLAAVLCVITALSVLAWASFTVEYTATTQTVGMAA